MSLSLSEKQNNRASYVGTRREVVNGEYAGSFTRSDILDRKDGERLR